MMMQWFSPADSILRPAYLRERRPSVICASKVCKICAGTLPPRCAKQGGDFIFNSSPPNIPLEARSHPGLFLSRVELGLQSAVKRSFELSMFCIGRRNE
jgi:hypothetical protein